MSKAKREVLFVCTGNTCRSPMAEGLFRSLKGTEDYEVSSAGVSASAGTGANPDTVKVLARRGVKLEGFRSRAVDQAMLEKVAAVFCMTDGHLAILESMFPEFADKYHLVCDFVEIKGRVGTDVPDPIGMGPLAYEEAAKTLDLALEGVRDYLEAVKE